MPPTGSVLLANPAGFDTLYCVLWSLRIESAVYERRKTVFPAVARWQDSFFQEHLPLVNFGWDEFWGTYFAMERKSAACVFD